MTAPPDDTTADTSAIIAALRAERDAGLAREATLTKALATRTAELATRNSDYGERIEQQTATIDVLKAMSASPGDAQPVFDLIVKRAAAFCEGDRAGLALLDGELLHLKSYINHPNPAAYEATFPRPVSVTTAFGRAILAGDAIQIPDTMEDANYQRLGTERNSMLGVPLLRADKSIGAVLVGRPRPGEFSLAQVEMLKTFAEQAVIAITSAETYRALQTRTSDLQETLEYQTATSDVLKVISRSAFDLQPVLDTVVETAARLCDADMANIGRREGELVRGVAFHGYPPEFRAWVKSLGAMPLDRRVVGHRAALEGRIVHVHDVAAEPNYPTGSIALGKMRTTLAVPLLREGETVGAIVLARQRVEPFTDRQIELVSTFADQAVIAIENTRLLTEQREALEQQTATAEVLQVINSSPGELEPVFEAMLDRAMRLCEAAFGEFGIFDGERFKPAALLGVPAAYAAVRAGTPRTDAPGTVGRHFREGASIAHIADLMAEEIYQSGNPDRRSLVDLGGARTMLAVALRKDEALLGEIMIYRQEVRPFSDRQIALLQNFAAQAVIAMENARLLTEQREALEQQTATAEVLQVINASPGNLAPVFDAMLEKAMRLCGAAFGSLYTYDGEHFVSAAQRGVPPAYAAFRAGHPPMPAQGTGIATLVETRKPVHALDVTASELYRAGHPGLRAMAELGGVRTSLVVPLLKDDALLGFISVYRQEVRGFSDKQIALLENFAAQAVIAMENARLITEQREALEQQTATAEVLQVINANPDDLGPVFDMILEKAHRLCDIGMGALLTCDAGQHRAVATRGYSPEADAHARRLRPILDNLAALAKSGAVLHHPDVSRADSPLSDDFGRTFIALTGARTYLVVPLSKEGTLLGTITAVRSEVRPFTERQITLLRNFAAQAVIAMENARLINEQREALEQQTATAEVLQVINASPGNLAPVFDAMLEKAMRLSGAAYGVLRSYDGEHLHMLASRGVPTEYAEFLARSGGPGTPGDSPMPGTAPMHALETRQPTLRLDVRESIGYTSKIPATRAIADLGGARTCLHVPLVKDQVAVGLLTFYRQEVRAFSDKQIALLQNFAAQAVIAMENARLLTEQREALEQQTATAEVLQVINTSPGDLVPVFDAILEKALNLCGAAFGILLTYDGERFHHAAFRSIPSAYVEFMREHPPIYAPESAPGRLALGERLVHLLDITDTDAYRSGDANRRAMADLAGARTIATVSLRKDSALVGAIAVFRQEVRSFSDKQIAVLENFAAQAVIAMENARLITEQREALEQQTATSEVLAVINASPGNLAPVFDVMLEKAMRLCGAAFGLLYTYNGELFHTVAHSGVPAALAEFRSKHPPSARPGGSAAPLIETMRPVHILDMMEQEFYRAGDAINRATVDLGGARTTLTVPLLKDDALLGVISIYRQEVRAFSAKQIALLESFAAQAVIAIENARLLDEIRQRQEELRVTFENMGDGVAMFDETQHLVAWNRKFQDILDVPDEALAARRTFVEYIRYLTERGEFGQGAEQEEQVRRIQATRGRATVFERSRPNGRVIEVRQNPVPGGGFVLIYADITERKRSEAEIRAARDAAEQASRTIEAAYRELKTAQANLIQAEKMASLGQLTAGIAHEIKNPLNFVNNFAALSVDLLSELKETAAPGFAALTDKQRAEVEEVSVMLTNNLEKITEHGKRADGIVKAMLEHSRGSSGERRMVELNALIDEALNLAYHGARAQDQSFNIAMERDFGEGIAAIEVSPQDITRMFLNLFANGFYATTKRAREGGDAGFVPTLKVTTRDAGETVEVRVRDNGTGIPADIRDKLFQPFFTTKPTGEGTGLGLSITYDIVTQQHGGSIAVDSKVGDYSEFTIRLPRKP